MTQDIAILTRVLTARYDGWAFPVSVQRPASGSRSSSGSMSVIAALAEQGVTADRDGLHVMPPEMLQGAVSMQEECKEFLSKTKQFNDIVGDFIDVMESKSKVIEAEKLRAIGLANRVDHEKEVRKRKQVRVPSLLLGLFSIFLHASATARSLCVAAGAAGDDQREKD